MHAQSRTKTGGKPSRREFLALGVGAFVVAAVPLAARSRRRVVRRSVPVMGTLADLVVVTDGDAAGAHAAIDAAVRELRWVDRTMTRFADTSDVGRANRLAARAGVRVRPETGAVLEEALLWAQTTDGAFDPCLGRAAVAWEVTERRRPPAEAEVRRLAGRGLWRSLDVDRSGAEAIVRFEEADVAIDLGGIAKGYGVDRAAIALRAAGIEAGLVNAGGDLYAIGVSEDGDPWRVGIRDPADPDRLAGQVAVEDEAVATSGDYARFFRHAGRTYHHLLDPETAAPRDAPVHSVTVVAATCLQADAAATAAFGLGRPDAARVLGTRAPGARIVTRGRGGILLPSPPPRERS